MSTETDKKKLTDLIPDAHNYNKGTEKGRKLIGKSLKKLGAGRSVLIDKHGNVIAGNKTLEGAAAAGIDEVIVVKTTGKQIVAVQRTDLELDSQKGREMAIADNATGAANLSWDMEAMAADGWTEKDLGGWGVEWSGAAAETPEAVEDDYELPEEIQTDIVLGDLFEIGPHRLLCGDSTVREDVDRLMGGEKADMVFFDPPHNDSSLHCLYELMRSISPDACIFWMTQDVDMVLFLSERMADFSGFFVYDFHFGIQQKDQPFLSHFLIAKMANCRDRFINTGDGLKTVIRHGLMRGRAISEYHHNQAKSVLLMRDLIVSHCIASICDLFCGSGTTMVAAHQLSRRCFGMEIDPKYCQVILDRMLKLAPDLEVKKNGEPYNNNVVTT